MAEFRTNVSLQQTLDHLDSLQTVSGHTLKQTAPGVAQEGVVTLNFAVDAAPVVVPMLDGALYVSENGKVATLSGSCDIVLVAPAIADSLGPVRINWAGTAEDRDAILDGDRDAQPTKFYWLNDDGYDVSNGNIADADVSQAGVDAIDAVVVTGATPLISAADQVARLVCFEVSWAI